MANYRDPLTYHSSSPAGKIGTCITKPLESLADLAVAYTPGVASPCSTIAAMPSKVYDYTGKGNLVGMITNGTSVLGLGNIGALAAKPVMEGKAMLMKKLAGIDCFDLEINEQNPQTLAKMIEAVSPTFGAINLEDIKAPECFEVERILIERLNIPVVHDDQHGTAITTAAALVNALFLAKKSLDKINIVMYGAGAGGIATAKLLLAMGAKKSKMVMFDSKGLLDTSRKELPVHKVPFVTKRKVASLDEAMEGADVFLGFSVGDVLKPVHLTKMAESPIIFAMANPRPEIDPLLARRQRPEVIMGTGGANYPNQINHTLVFPYLFRGLLDVRATRLTEGIKLALVEALAALGRGEGEEAYTFDAKHLLPNALDRRLLTTLTPAVAKKAMEEGIAQRPIKNWTDYMEKLKGVGPG
ncbi:MAG: malic enzyme-like NAD(P)-binding protein [Bacteroidota bacterium]